MIKFFDLQKQYRLIKEEINSAVQGVLQSGHFILGKEVGLLEQKIAELTGAKYAIGVNSGTDALLLSLMALGIKEKDEVLVPDFTFFATAEVIALLGAKPVFIDINPRTFNIDSKKIEAAITKKTKAIIPVHLFGQPAEMDLIMKIAKKYKLFVIEDAAQAIGAKYKGKPAGHFGDLACLSFFPSKNLGACGDAGMVLTSSKRLAEKLRLLRTHGSSPGHKYLNLILGLNSRLDTIQAVILLVKLKYFQLWTKQRIKNAKKYNQAFKKLNQAGQFITPFILSQVYHVFHQYTVRTTRRNELQKFLREQNIPTQIYYPLPLHLQPAFKYLGYQKGDFPEAEKAAQEVLSLPIYPEFLKKEQDLIIRKIKNFFT